VSSAFTSESDEAPFERRVRRSQRWFQIVMLLAFAGLAGVVYWQGRSIQAALANTQRAFVVLKDATFLPVRHGTNELAWQFADEWENAGNTNSEDLTTQISYWTGPGLSPGFSKTMVSPSRRRPFTLGPHATVKLPSFILSQEALGAARQSPGFLIIWGSAIYRDVLPGHGRRMTRFCYRVTWIGGDPANADNNLDVRYDRCSEGNCSDEDCARQGYAETAPGTLDGQP
jgi:hypothetical protein